MTTPTTPPAPTDEELEARLRASWQHAVARAEGDLSRGTVAVSLAAGGRRGRGRTTAGVLVGAAAILVLMIALIAGAGGREPQPRPSASPVTAAGTPTPTAGSPAPTGTPSAAPDGTLAPNEPTQLPQLEPWGSFPPALDGRPIHLAGPDADAALAAATDDTPFLVGGWLLGSDAAGCPTFECGSPAPNGVVFDDRVALRLRAAKDGGATLPVHWSFNDPDAMPQLRSSSLILPTVLEVHAHDPGCTADDCAHEAVLDRIAMDGSAEIAPQILAATMPPGGLSLEAAVAAARAWDVSTKMGFGEPKVLLSAQAGPLVIVDAPRGDFDLHWYWVVRFASDDGHSTYEVFVDYVAGTVTNSGGGTLRP